MKIYTKTGDRGQTGRFGGARVDKHDPSVEAYGELDELNSVRGLVRTEALDPDVGDLLVAIQSRLFDIGAEIACQPDARDRLGSPFVDEDDVVALERAIDAADERLSKLTSFVLPGGTRAAALLHVARTVCRRAERRIVALARSEPVRDEVVRYVNRLSDLLFTWARLENARAHVADIPWKGRERGR